MIEWDYRKLLLIAAGGAAGSLLRYGMAGWVQRGTDSLFPLGTMSVNVLGCLVIGLLGAMFAGPSLVREAYRAALMVGVLGGFTTFSSFALETFSLADKGQLGWAAANVVLTNVFCLTAAWGGYRLGQQWFGA